MEDIPLYIGKRKNIIVISGGGLKGFTALGALTRLMELEIIVNPDIYCGTSVGSVICLLMIIGYSPRDIYDILYDLEMDKLIVTNIENIFEDVHIGLNTINPMMYIIGFLMKSQKVKICTTFMDLYKKFNVKFIVTGTCVNDASLHYFSHELTPNMRILDAIRISVSIPILFKPHLYNNKVWIDGGCMNNYPIELFHDKMLDVVGIYMDDDYTNYETFEDIQTYVKQIMNSFLRGLSLNKVNFYKNNTIEIKCNLNSTDWSVTNESKELMFKCGYECVVNKFG